MKLINSKANEHFSWMCHFWLVEIAFTKKNYGVYTLLYTCLIFSLFIVFTNFYTCIFLQPVYVSSKTNASIAILLKTWYIRTCTTCTS